MSRRNRQVKHKFNLGIRKKLFDASRMRNPIFFLCFLRLLYIQIRHPDKFQILIMIGDIRHVDVGNRTATDDSHFHPVFLLHIFVPMNFFSPVFHKFPASTGSYSPSYL